MTTDVVTGRTQGATGGTGAGAPAPTSTPGGAGVGPAARYAERSVAPAARDVVGARLRTRGMIRLGRGWWPYRGHEVTLPTHGYFRELRVVGGLRIVDSWVAGHARRDTALLGRHLHPALVGPDLARADIAHAALSALWVPSVLADPETARWSAEGHDTASVSFAVAGAPVALHLALHRGGLPRQVTTVRWGDPEHTGFFRDVPFGVEILEHRTFGGLTVPTTGILGWRIGAPGPTREILRFQVTDLEPVPGTAPLPGELGETGRIPEDCAEGDSW